MKLLASIRRGVALILLLALLPSCVSYHSATVPEISSIRQRDLRLTLDDQSKVILMRALLQSDTIRGYRSDGQAQARSLEAIPLANVQGIEVREFAKGRAIALGLIGVTAIFFALMSSIDVP